MHSSVEARNVDGVAESRRREAERYAAEQRAAFPLEYRMRFHVHENVKIASRCSPRSGFSPTGKADARAVIDSRRNFHIECLNLVDPPFPATIAARRFDDLARPVAIGARTLDHEKALLCTNLARTVAQFAAAAACPRLGARAGAGVTGGRDFDLDLRIFSVKRFFQTDLHIVPQICPATRTSATAGGGAATESASEDRFEDVADIVEILRAAAPALLERGVTITIVGRALLRVFQNLVRRAAGLEAVFRVVIARIAIGMILHRHFAIGGFDRRPVGIASDAEDFIEVDFSRHARTPKRHRHRRGSRRWRFRCPSG